jgi:hypothetical protein
MDLELERSSVLTERKEGTLLAPTDAAFSTKVRTPSLIGGGGQPSRPRHLSIYLRDPLFRLTSGSPLGPPL